MLDWFVDKALKCCDMLLPQISSFQKQSVFALMSGFILAYHKKSHQLFFSRFISFGIIDLFYAERTHQCYYGICMAWDFKNVDPTILRYLYIQSEKISQLSSQPIWRSISKLNELKWPDLIFYIVGIYCFIYFFIYLKLLAVCGNGIGKGLP